MESPALSLRTPEQIRFAGLRAILRTHGGETHDRDEERHAGRAKPPVAPTHAPEPQAPPRRFPERLLRRSMRRGYHTVSLARG